jgi:hypothetical protein
MKDHRDTKREGRQERGAISVNYRGVVINGYDSSGGLWFSREVDSEEDFAHSMQDAWSVDEVVGVEATFCHM